MRKHLEIAEKAFVILSLTFFTGGFGVGSSPVTLTPGIIPAIIITAIRYFIWTTASILICIHWKKALITASRDIFIWILTPIILASSIWSLFPEFTAQYMREVWQITTFSLYFATRFSVKEQLKLVAWTFTIGILLSIFFAVGLPTIGKHVDDHPGAWKGIYDYKNTFGSMMVLSSLAFFLLPVENLRGRLYKWAGFGLSLLMMLLSTSKTSLVLSFVMILILLLYRNFQWRGKISVIFLDIGILIFGCISTVVLVQWVSLLTGLGKDPTLTGRTQIWGSVLTRLEESPWLGFGRGAYWIKGSKYAIEAGQAVSENFIPPHAHNGFIDLALDVGVIGLSIFLVSFAIAYLRALKQAYAAKKSEDFWPLAVLVFLALNNVMESYFLRLANVYWVLYITSALSVNQRRRMNISPNKKSIYTVPN